MALTVSISVASRRRDPEVTFVSILDCFLSRSAVRDITVRERHPAGPRRCLQWNQEGGPLVELVAGVSRSDKALEIDCGYQLKSGRSIALQLHFHGDQYNGGEAVRESGPIRLTFSHGQLAKEVRAATENVDVSTNPNQLGVVGEAAIADAEELFFRSCLLFDSDGDPVDHGAMYSELGWPSPAGCSMVFHKDVAEYALDVERIFLDYQTGALMPEMISFGSDVVGQPFRRPSVPVGREHSEFFRQVSKHDWPAMFKFLEGLSEKSAVSLRSFDSETIRRHLLDSCASIPEVVCHDFGDKGYALATDPLSSVWQVYQELLK